MNKVRWGVLSTAKIGMEKVVQAGFDHGPHRCVIRCSVKASLP